MTVGLSGIGLGILYIALMALFIIVLLVTSLRLLIEKGNTQQPFRNLKTARFFFANLFTGLFLLLVALILDRLKMPCLFLDRCGLLPYITVFLAAYFVPFICLARFFKPARK